MQVHDDEMIELSQRRLERVVPGIARTILVNCPNTTEAEADACARNIVQSLPALGIRRDPRELL